MENQWLSAVRELHTAVADVNSTDALEELHHQIVKTAAGVFDCAVVRLALAEEDELVPTASSQDEPIEEIVPVPTTFGYAGQAFQSREIVRINDLTDTRSASSASSSTASGVGSQPTCHRHRALLSIPLEEYGVVQLYSSEAGAFTERDEERAALYAEHVCTALDQASQYYRQRRGRSVKTVKATTLTDTESLAVLDVHCCIEREHDTKAGPPITASKTGTLSTRSPHWTLSTSSTTAVQHRRQPRITRSSGRRVPRSDGCPRHPTRRSSERRTPPCVRGSGTASSVRSSFCSLSTTSRNTPRHYDLTPVPHFQ